MAQRYQNVMVAIDGSKKQTWLSSKVFTLLYATNPSSPLPMLSTRALQSVSTFDAEVYEELQVDAESLMKVRKARKRCWCDRYSHRHRKGIKKPSLPYYSRRRKCRPDSRWCNRAQCL